MDLPTYLCLIHTHTRSPQSDFEYYAEEGDIVATRPWNPPRFVGRKERHQFLWMLIWGLPYEQISDLHDAYYENDIPYDKRQYCIPLERLAEVDPAFDIARARDVNDFYQPYFTLDEVSGEVIATREAFLTTGLVYDKATLRFL